MNFCKSCARLGDAREDLKERTLACAVTTNDADDLTLLDLERDILESPKCTRLARVPPISMEEGFQIFRDLVTQGVMADSCHPDVVLLRKVLYANCNVSHSVGLVCGPTSRKANAVHLRSEERRV